MHPAKINLSQNHAFQEIENVKAAIIHQLVAEKMYELDY